MDTSRSFAEGQHLRVMTRGGEVGSVVPASSPNIDLSREIQVQRDAVEAGTHVFYRHCFMDIETARQIGYEE